MTHRFQADSNNRREFINTTSDVHEAARAAGVRQGTCLCEFDGLCKRSVQVQVSSSCPGS